jgi:hypothetical protein
MSTEPETPVKKYTGPATDYTLEGEKIIRTDKEGKIHVGNYVEGTLSLTIEGKRFRSPAVNFLGRQELPVTSVIMFGDEGKDPAAEEIPPCPKKLMQFGDKTPAVVEWYKRYKPAEYRARYGIVGEGEVTKYVKRANPETGKMESVPEQVQATLAHRKIHTTEKVEAGNADATGYADDDVKHTD